jgi:carbamoyl-phosphate synthase large subunit
MPKRNDLKKILLIGSGPIVIGQACEFDYSGTQALRALKEEGYEVILVNSNPATIMTDPDLSDRVYVEPLTPEFVERIIALEKPDALLPTLGGQTALNLTMELHRRGVLKKWNVEILGATPEAIHRAEDRETFRSIMDSIGVASARSRVARSIEDGKKILKEFGLPLILRPSFTLGGEGGGAAETESEFRQKLERALFLSPTHDVLIEENLTGWKEFELEVMRDRNDNTVIICSIENFDPMGVHTGDSITVAPAQTLTDREYQNLRDQAIRIIRAIGVETGGSNIQFAINPKDGRVIVIEMNPRVSRSSALASKATGFPIARIAAKLAVGYTLDELTNPITGSTPCSFEPSLDYVITKIPRFDFEKFRPTEPTLSTQMKSVGEVMGIGRTFEESLGKALASLETQFNWLKPLGTLPSTPEEIDWLKIRTPTPSRLFAVADALRVGASIDRIHAVSGIDPWFLRKIAHHLEGETILKKSSWPPTEVVWRELKKRGWTDRGIAGVLGKSEAEVRKFREASRVTAHFHAVDTCAAEFEAQTPYLYSSYRGSEEFVPPTSPEKRVLILGGGPNRIGQGIEFDYCCVHAAMALREAGYTTLMVNSNPETVSTDFDLSDRLYFEPLTPEHVLSISSLEKPLGAIVQFGGQTPLKIARALEQAGLPILGTSTQSIDWAEDREKCEAIVREIAPLGLKQPPAAIARTREEALRKAEELGFPLLVRPSYVLGGKGMRIAHSFASFEAAIDEAIELSEAHPVLIDRFLHRAIEVDVDAISDGHDVLIGGILEHIEEAGIHSGDSACCMPPPSLPVSITDRIRTYTRELARKLHVVGLMNVQFAVNGDQIYLLEVNPRASRTVPFVSKAIGKPLAKIAALVMIGRSLKDQGFTLDFDEQAALEPGARIYNVKAPVFPFHKFPGVDVRLGPEMKSTGEVMGRAHTFPAAFAKAMIAAGTRPPENGRVFFSIRSEDKAEALPLAQLLHALGFELWATSGTTEFLRRYDLPVCEIQKFTPGTLPASPRKSEAPAPHHCVEAIQNGFFQWVINTPSSDERAISDGYRIRRAALERKVPCSTVLASARALLAAIQSQRKGPLEILPLSIKGAPEC